MMRFKQYLIAGLLCVSAIGCHKRENAVPPKYEVVKIKDNYFLVDNESLDKKPIHDGLAGSLDDFVQDIEEQPDAINHCSTSFQLKAVAELIRKGESNQVYALLDPEQRKEFAKQEYKNLSEEEQWKLALIPLKKRAAQGLAYFVRDVERAVTDVKEVKTNIEHNLAKLKVEVSQQMMMESYQVLKHYFGADQTNSGVR